MKKASEIKRLIEEIKSNACILDIEKKSMIRLLEWVLDKPKGTYGID